MSIKILWLEDEHKDPKLRGTIAKATKLGFDITFCEFANDFISEIDAIEWDAIILDVIGFRHSGDTLGSDGFNLALDKILADYKNHPWFVFSGQAEITKKDSIIRGRLEAGHLKRNYANVMYVKGDDNDKLFADVKDAVEDIEDWRIRNQYADIFACSIDKDSMLKLLKALEHKEEKDTALLNEVRKILEDLFNECSSKRIIPAGIITLNDRSRHLCDRGMSSKIPIYIQRNIHSVTVISQEGSHVRTLTNRDVKSGKAPYLIRSTISELLNIILWWDQYKKANP